jgi:hypothetical protein
MPNTVGLTPRCPVVCGLGGARSCIRVMPIPNRRPGHDEAERRAALQRAFAADTPSLPADLTIRTDTPAPDAKQLAAVGITDPAELKLLAALHEQRDVLAQRIADEPAFRDAMDRKPASALADVGIPPELAELVQAGALKELLARIRGVVIEVPVDPPVIAAAPPAPTAAQRAGLELLAATLSSARADANTAAALRRAPRPVVIGVAAANPPTTAAAPAALATVVDQVTTAFERVHGIGGLDASSGMRGEQTVRTVRLRTDRGR